MKVSALLATSLVAVALSVVGAGSAQADDFVGTDNFADNYSATDYPQSCLIVQNHIGDILTVRMDYPTGYGHWEVAPEEVGWLDWGDYPVTSPSGHWQLHVYPPVQNSWVFDAGATRGGSCNGSWIFTAS
ncbi:hypothetical protein ACTWPB_00555 [Nocardia sp. IBHARD005]|uniref:hypothetical protein n=1 Tax=Nocardia sp. IBHARD005 TaxID=3457765 RepID=UPI00405861E0